MISSRCICRRAEPEDLAQLSNFVDHSHFTHRHLDWRAPLDWLGRQPFWLMEEDGIILGTLAFPMDPDGIAWVRLFAAGTQYLPSTIWETLFSKAKKDLPPHAFIAALSLNDWFGALLERESFVPCQRIVVLSYQGKPNPIDPLPNGFTLRIMKPEDLPAVTELDLLAFQPLWRYSLETITLAYHQEAYATVIERGGEIIGYQLSTASVASAHLARLAVNPNCQRQGLGSYLVADLLEHFWKEGFELVTVNTQNDNASSLALYQNMGFLKSGEEYPVFIHQP
ncbi:MAG TPA: GNAT family N-acetyltransferase [Longilinea sp.]|nr:GNAT family N-acetyltransferase [Longilinea sp.]